MEINKERVAFEKAMKSRAILDLDYVQYHEISNKYVIQNGLKGEYFKTALDCSHVVNVAWMMWQDKATPEGFVLVDKKQTEDWYLDDHEGMWWEQDGIDNSLCDLDPGEVQAVEHKEYLITESNTLYAAKVWDDFNDQVGDWEFFKTKDEADKTAAYCKAKFKGEVVEAREQSHDNSN